MTVSAIIMMVLG
ncbi:putative membrane protein, partial [Vibrio parahaemolyticus VPTS-2010_2]